jgi:hypothetical protein
LLSITCEPPKNGPDCETSRAQNASPTGQGLFEASVAQPPNIETLRRKLDAAILAEAWDAVNAIRARMVEIERAGVVDLNLERARRGR